MLHLPGEMMPGQFGPSRRVAGKSRRSRAVDERLVLGRDVLGDADDEADAGLGGLEDRGRRAARRHGDEAGVRAGRVDRLGDGVEDRDALDVLAALARGDAGDDLRAVGAVAQPVEAALARR